MVAGAAALGRVETFHCSRQPLIVLLVAHQRQNKPYGRLFNHDTRSLVSVWGAFPWVQLNSPRTWDLLIRGSGSRGLTNLDDTREKKKFGAPIF